MKIIIDLQSLQTESAFRGIGRYSLSLVSSLVKIGFNHEFILLFNSSSKNNLDESVKSIRSCNPNVSIRYFHALDNIHGLIKEHDGNVHVSELIRDYYVNCLEPDYLFITSVFEGTHGDFVCALNENNHYSTGVIGYDLIPLTNPSFYLGSPEANYWYDNRCENIKRATHIFTISESVSNEFLEFLKVSEDKVVNISSAVDEIFKVLDVDDYDQSLLNDLSISKKFILYTGAMDQRKNLSTLLEAYALMAHPLRERFKIVLVGKYNEYYKNNIITLAKNLDIKIDDVIFTGYIDDSELCQLYNQCFLFIFPSLHEGFGLPVLEAMACGAPTICSNSSSLPEVVGIEEAMFDPKSPEKLSELMTKALTNDEFRSLLKYNASERVKLFSWDKCAKTLLKQIESSPKVEYTEYNFTDSYKKLLQSIADSKEKVRFDELLLKKIAKCIALNELELAKTIPKEKLSWRIEGPFDSSYSLALLNRETARALSAIGQSVVLYSTEGPGDFEPNPEFLAINNDLKNMYMDGLSRDQEVFDVVSRNLYPPRVSGMQGTTNILHHYAWEESGFPYEWVLEFNNNLNGMTCLSDHVRKIMIDNGVAIPLFTSGCGTDHWHRIVSDQNYRVPGKKFKFLHVSSCFPRKGADVLLRAYGEVFNSDDDVTLIIKTFNNPHNTIKQELAQLRNDNPLFPDVILILEDLCESKLKALYKSCDILVAPSLAEGFGLPMAEAIHSGLGVITTGWGGQLDFCDSETAWIVDYEFELANTHFGVFDSVWARPKLEDLKKKMCEVFNCSHSEIMSKVNAARVRLDEHFTWENVAIRLVNQTMEISKYSSLAKDVKIGWISTWNQRCGIASYSEHLVNKSFKNNTTIFAPRDEGIKSSGKVVKCWDNNGNDDLIELRREIESRNIEFVVVQWNYGFYEFGFFSDFILSLKSKGIGIVVVLHSTKDPSPERKLVNIKNALSLCDRVMVHTVSDLNRLKSIGLINNTCIFPHGIELSKESCRNDYGHKSNKIQIASYGFALPHKGIIELIEAFSLVANDYPNLELLLLNAEHPDPSSNEFIKKVKDRLGELNLFNNVIINNNYLDEGECQEILAGSDFIVMPYQNTGESSSAAVRTALSSGSPVLVTPLAIFDDVSEAVTYLPGLTVDEIAKGLTRFLNGDMKWNRENAENWIKTHNYDIVSNRLHNIIGSLMINQL